ADQLIAAKEFLGHIIKADALAKLGRHTLALQEYATGVKLLKALPKEYETVLERILASHPDLQIPNSRLIRDDSLALKHYGLGLENYRNGQYEKAEQEFFTAIGYDNRDARYLYFLGLARWQQGNTDVAIRTYKAAALVEMQGKPTGRLVNSSLERIQGPTRLELEKYRP
ncbi:MAG: tetratricopeptide repeat protein, partial [Planctomycetes bacterium]|nr:tetratricopeptide repeat protein [Planctomycetota bacterium]